LVYCVILQNEIIDQMMKRLAIFASGNGSNAQAIADYFSESSDARVVLILSNRKDAFVLQRAKALEIPVRVFNRVDFYETEVITRLMIDQQIDMIILAGFLWLLPSSLINAYPDRIINIHPALLPKYGGKGMYGSKVHSAVIQAGEKESGISIHLVNENYDQGKIIFQARCTVEKEDTPETLAAKIHVLEYTHFPAIINQVLKTL
jgi:phosphoribosylglycinamide formyltransferase-1